MLTPIKFSKGASETPPFVFETQDQVIKFLDNHKDDINLLKSGNFRRSGWSYNFRPFLKRFVCLQYGYWHQMWAPSMENAKAHIESYFDEDDDDDEDQYYEIYQIPNEPLTENQPTYY